MKIGIQLLPTSYVFRVILIIFLSGIFCLCETTSINLAHPKQAYVYGKLLLKGTDGAGDIYISLRNTKTSSTVDLPLLEYPNAYSISSVSPGEYEVFGGELKVNAGGSKPVSLYTNKGKRISGKTFTVNPGEAVYLGDFIGLGSVTSGYNVTYYHISLDLIEYEFANTTRQLLISHPSFNGFIFKEIDK